MLKYSSSLQGLQISWTKTIRGLKLVLFLLFDHKIILDTADISIIVFSKDRPVQLEALLRSVLKYFKGNCSWNILWRATNKEYSQAYESMFSRITLENVSFFRETDFKSNLIDLLKASRNHGVMFMVDDLIFVDSFDATTFINLDLLYQIASLRLWPGASYCQPQTLQSPPPALELSFNRPWQQFSWRESPGDWAMPLSMDGHLLSRSEILRLIKYLHFTGPNSLEKALGEFRYLFKYRKGLCMSNPVIRNFAFNRVQSDNEDFPCGSWSSERMLEQWLNGWQLDIEALAGLDAQSCHVEVEPIFERRARL